MGLGHPDSRTLLLNRAAPSRPSEDPHGHLWGPTRKAQPSASLPSQLSRPRLSLQTFSLSFSSLNAEYSAVCRCSLSTRLSRSSRIFSSKVCCWFTRSVTRLESHRVKADRENQLHTGSEEPGFLSGVGDHVPPLGTVPASQCPSREAAALSCPGTAAGGIPTYPTLRPSPIPPSPRLLYSDPPMRPRHLLKTMTRASTPSHLPAAPPGSLSQSDLEVRTERPGWVVKNTPGIPLPLAHIIPGLSPGEGGGHDRLVHVCEHSPSSGGNCNDCIWDEGKEANSAASCPPALACPFPSVT